MQITWELFEIVKGLAKCPSRHQDVIVLRIRSTTVTALIQTMSV